MRVDADVLLEGKWEPLSVEDLQLEFIRLDPYYRLNFEAEIDRKTGKAEPGRYRLKFKAPDVLGIYKMEISYKRYGLTYVDEMEQVSVI